MHRPLREPDLLPAGPLRRLGRTVLLFDEIDSTNAQLLSRAGSLPDGAVALAEFQTAGRGRRGRPWSAPRGSSVLLSILLFEDADSVLTTGGTKDGNGCGAPLAAMLGAVAACEAVEAASDCQPMLRWPNDLVCAGKKLAGVLAEATRLTGGGSTARPLVIGVGLNCLQQRGHFAGPLADTATSLEIESASPIDRARVARALLERLDAHVSADLRTADARRRLREAWMQRCADLGTRATLRHSGADYPGTVIDVSPEGDLVVELDRGGRRHFASATTTRLS